MKQRSTRPWWANYFSAYLVIGTAALLVDSASPSGLALFRLAGIIALGSGLVILAAAVAFSLRSAFSTMRRRSTHCPACNYNLTGNVSGVCPECGTPVPWKAEVKS